MIDYQILRSRRKTLALQVKQGQVFVRAPLYLDEQFISAFIQKKEAWLKAKITAQNITVDLCCDYTQGAKIFLFGQLVTLNIIFTCSVSKNDIYRSTLDNNQQVLVIVFPFYKQKNLTLKSQLTAAVKKSIERYLKQQAINIILPNVEQYSQITQLVPTSIKIRQYRARWGSCNNRGELNFNYLLMMLPITVINYVIVHELCHLRYLNHSTDFWQLVAKHYPDYEIAKQWIKTHQAALQWQQPSAP
ncbi:MAG: M48 family metallopeptidase [Colwellia sp.]|nr:M48 family metallopeptidase [Colwellia sp.]